MKPKTAIIKNVVIPFVDEALGYAPIPPELKGAWIACKVSYGLFTDLYPDEGKEFLEQVRKNAIEIGDILISSKDFQQSLALTFEALLRTREQKKRDLIKQIYLGGYISADDRQNVNLERFYRVTQEISLEALEYLKFIADEILPKKEQWAKEEVAKMNKENRENDDEWWFKRTMQGKSDSEVIMQWIYEEYNPNSKTVKSKMPNVEKDKLLMNQQWEAERKKQEQYAEISSELIALGIFRSYVKDEGIGGGAGSVQKLTDFGHRFIDFVRTLSFIKIR